MSLSLPELCLNSPIASLTKAAYLRRRWKREIGSELAIDRYLNMRAAFQGAKRFRHYMCAMPLSTPDDLVQGFAIPDRESILDNGGAFVQLLVHKVHGNTKGFLVVVHLPESRHHSLVSWEWSMVDVNATHGRNGEHFLLENERASDGDENIGLPPLQAG